MKKVGIIGCGNIAQVHAWVLHDMKDAELVAVCDTDAAKAQVLSEKWTEGKAKVFTDWRKLCHAELDVVHICTPHYLHAPMAVELLKQGKTVFMEKPCAISGEQFEELKQIDKKHPGKLGFCFQNRYNETTLAMDKMVEEGLIGEIRGARAFVTWRRDE
ncbi:MAG: Gfo/Idh/MocA family oxidoreductase, partial [Lachnospiraceae bacterium]|nr:Gfo/Idh/MocA family oxidoreductase [Lachnospiraceae bacterium]